MATFSSAAIAPPLSLNPPRRFTSLSSSSSVFSSSSVCNRARLGGLAADRPRAAKRRGMSCNCVFGLGVPELVVIVGVATLLFGPKKLPEVGKSIGKTLKSFQQAAKEFETELKKDIDEPSAEASNEKKITTVSEEEKQEDKVPTANGSS